jgi:hypothetical protein
MAVATNECVIGQRKQCLDRFEHVERVVRDRLGNQALELAIVLANYGQFKATENVEVGLGIVGEARGHSRAAWRSARRNDGCRGCHDCIQRGALGGRRPLLRGDTAPAGEGRRGNDRAHEVAPRPCPRRATSRAARLALAPPSRRGREVHRVWERDVPRRSEPRSLPSSDVRTAGSLSATCGVGGGGGRGGGSTYSKRCSASPSTRAAQGPPGAPVDVERRAGVEVRLASGAFWRHRTSTASQRSSGTCADCGRAAQLSAQVRWQRAPTPPQTLFHHPKTCTHVDVRGVPGGRFHCPDICIMPRLLTTASARTSLVTPLVSGCVAVDTLPIACAPHSRPSPRMARETTGVRTLARLLAPAPFTRQLTTTVCSQRGELRPSRIRVCEFDWAARLPVAGRNISRASCGAIPHTPHARTRPPPHTQPGFC